MFGDYFSKFRTNLSSSTTRANDHPTCYSYEHKPLFHDFGSQRYASPTTGKCRPLKVQSTEPRNLEVGITYDISKLIQTSRWLVDHPPRSFGSFCAWFLKWFWFLYLIWYSLFNDQDPPLYTGFYKAYPMEFWGQLWAARSKREFSLRMEDLEQRQLTLPATIKEEDGDIKDSTVTHALYPRQLIIRDSESKEWKPCTDSNTNIRIHYVAISYRQTDFPNKVKLRKDVEEAVSELGYEAYWLDHLCTGETQDEKNVDLYRIADVFRGAARTLIFIRETPDEPRSEGWLSWGARVWTLPEALLSAYLMVKVGDGAIREISLRQVANFAYHDNDEEMKIINGFSGKDQLERLEKLTLLKEAIWRRSSGPTPNGTAKGAELESSEFVPGTSNQILNVLPAHRSGSEFTAYPAEKVYALMGFFEHRILPDRGESDLQALARLSMANDSDRIVERMVSMLPNDIKDQACWYSDHDLYDTNLWDIEPEVQAVGVSQYGALVLDGVRAATIRWKNFPRVAYDVKPSVKRSICGLLPLLFFLIIIIGHGLLALPSKTKAIVFIIIGLLGLIISPYLVVYADSGRVVDTQPWLIGVKGVITAHQASIYCYGEDSLNPKESRISYSPTGTILSHAEHGPMRCGDSVLSEKAAFEAQRKDGNVYTLIDTCSDTIYHFTASKPPTVAVFTGKEGGLGRFVLCSETCQKNELHKETVLRMPTYISKSMRSCGWLAIGGAFDT